MTQNIEQRTEVAVTKYEGAATSVDEIAHTDKEVDTPVGKRNSFPKISREWSDESQRLQKDWGDESQRLQKDWGDESLRLQTEWNNDSAVIREDWQTERNELSTKALGVKPWESGQAESNINQQRRWTDNHTYLPKTVPAVMDASGPNNDWIPYTADKSDVLQDVYGRKPMDLYNGAVITPDTLLQYPKLNALGKVWELNDSDQPLTVKNFSESSDGYLVITLNNDQQVVAHNVSGASRKYVDNRVIESREGIGGVKILDGTISSLVGKNVDEYNALYIIRPDKNRNALVKIPTSTTGVIESIDLAHAVAVISGAQVKLIGNTYSVTELGDIKYLDVELLSYADISNGVKYLITSLDLHRTYINDNYWTPSENKNSFTLNNGSVAVIEEDNYKQLPSQNYNYVAPKPASLFTNELLVEIHSDNDKNILLSQSPNWNYVFFTEPVVITRPDGRVLMFSTAKYAVDNVNPPDPGQAVYRADATVKISDSNGEKWQDIKIISSLGDDYQHFVGGAAYDQSKNRIWVGVTSYKGMVGHGFSQPGFDESTTAQSYVVYSDDNGDTWSTPENITVDVKNPNHYLNWLPPCSGVTMPDGTICFTQSSLRTLNGEISVGYIRLKSGESTWDFAEEIVKDSDYQGSGGGETSLFLGRLGRLSAFVRTNFDNASYHRVYERAAAGWVFRNEVKTSEVKAGIYYCDTSLGFDRNRLLVTAPIGENEDYLGRRNPFLFDGDAGTPIGRLSPKHIPLNEVSEYSDITLMSNGSFLCIYMSWTAKVRGIIFTPNRVAGMPFLQVPYAGTKRIKSSELLSTKFDLKPGELVIEYETEAPLTFNDNDFHFLATKPLKTQEITSPMSGLIDVTKGDMVRFLGGADGSNVTGISGGSYYGQKCVIFVSSTSALTVIHETSSSENSIQFTNAKDPEGGGNFDEIKMQGGTATLNPSMIVLRWLGKDIGWQTTTPANYK